MIIRSALKKKLLKGERVIGTFVGLDSVDTVEILGRSGFDFVILDMEHAPGAPNSIMGQIRAAEGTGMDVLARLTNVERTTVLRTLDLGVSGVLAPQVNDAVTARSFIDATLYPPLGCRGFAGTRAAAYGSVPILEYIAEANTQLLRMVQCETEQAVRDVEEIASIKDIDLIFVGPYDLSLSLGVPGDMFHPKMAEAVAKVLAVCGKFGKLAGIFVSSEEEMKKRIEQGFTFFAYSMDTMIFAAAAKAIADGARRLADER
ncbi:MAG: 4-hydroxy-2-oxovalerate aldolase [Synergistaceae bacterium]|jgi:4-hydroxy-2-oxoheptanedioate aldolase|nr:4-hydroxy-2-oxovalerate aldolase [Synergistaceae bacterium]